MFASISSSLVSLYLITHHVLYKLLCDSVDIVVYMSVSFSNSSVLGFLNLAMLIYISFGRWFYA